MLRVALPFGVGTPEPKRDFYRNALREAGLLPVEDFQSLADLDGLLLAGGTDVDPSLYGEQRHPLTEEPDRARDDWEIALVREALDRDLPLMGICRGLQLFNVAMGGSLVQHIDGHSRKKERDVHMVRIRPGSLLESILGVREYMVNSRHHQCAGRIGASLQVTAESPDGIVEALELPGKRFVLAVQWHPEARTDGADSKLFHAFHDAMRR